MIININASYRIHTDPAQFILEYKGKPRPGKPPRKGDGWRNIGFCGRLSEIFDLMWRREVFADDGEYPPTALHALVVGQETMRADVQTAMAELAPEKLLTKIAELEAEVAGLRKRK